MAKKVIVSKPMAGCVCGTREEMADLLMDERLSDGTAAVLNFLVFAAGQPTLKALKAEELAKFMVDNDIDVSVIR